MYKHRVSVRVGDNINWADSTFGGLNGGHIPPYRTQNGLLKILKNSYANFLAEEFCLYCSCRVGRPSFHTTPCNSYEESYDMAENF